MHLYIEDVDPEIVFESQKGICGLCYTPMLPTDPSHQLDHIRPLSMDGEHSYANLQAVHSECHKSKTALDATLIKRYKSWKHASAVDHLRVRTEIQHYLDRTIKNLTTC